LGNDTRLDEEEEYTPEEFAATVQGIRDVGAGFRLGGRVDADHLRLARTEAGGRLAAGGIPGVSGGWTSTVAALVRFDTRDRRTGPSRGIFLQAEAGGSGRVLGSDYAYRSYLLDARGYLPALASQVIAVRGITRLSGGAVPFHRMPVLGGAELLRGYYEGRFRDRQLAAFQVEDRIPVAGRFGVALFAGTGPVAGTVSRFRVDRFHPAWGWGARVVLSREDSLVLRLDQGYGEDQSGFYLSIGEAY
jgi:outer membrane protein assembly factor BamA